MQKRILSATLSKSVDAASLLLGVASSPSSISAPYWASIGQRERNSLHQAVRGRQSHPCLDGSSVQKTICSTVDGRQYRMPSCRYAYGGLL